MAIMRRGLRGRIDQANLAGGGSRIPEVQHNYAGNCIQRISGIFPDDAAGRGFRVDVGRQQGRNVGGIPEFHGFSAAG